MAASAEITELFAKRTALIGQRSLGILGVIVNGLNQDDGMVSLVRPIVEAELDRRLYVVEARLRHLGAVIA